MIYLIDPRNTTKPYNFELLWALRDLGIKYKFLGAMPRKIENPPVTPCNCFLPLTRGILGNQKNLAKFIANVSQTPEMLLGWLNFKRILKKEDILHFLWVTSPSIESIILPTLENKVKNLIHTAHNILPHRNRKKDYSLFKNIYPCFNHIILHSKATKKEFIKLFPEINEKKISTIYVGNYERFYKTHDKTTENDAKKFKQRVFFFMGPIKSYKGFDVLCNAIKLLKNTDFKILIHANWKSKDEHFIIHSKPLSYQRLGLLYRASDIVILSHTKVSLPNSLFESAYFAKPVIASNLGVAQYIVRDGKEGFLVEPGSPESLKEAMVKALSISEKELKSMGESLKHRSIKKFSWKSIAEKLALIYES